MRLTITSTKEEMNLDKLRVILQKNSMGLSVEWARVMSTFTLVL